MYEPAVCSGCRGDLESLESRGASLRPGMRMGSGGDCGRRRNPRNGIFGVLVCNGAADWEYTDEPLTMDRTLKCSPPNLEEKVDAGDPSILASKSCSGRGDRPNNGVGGK